MHMNGFDTYKRIDGCVVGDCGFFTQLSGDPLNRVLWYVGVQECLALRRTCRGMSQLQPDLGGLRSMLGKLIGQKSCQQLRQDFEPYIDNMERVSVAYFWQNLLEFLRQCEFTVHEIE